MSKINIFIYEIQLCFNFILNHIIRFTKMPRSSSTSRHGAQSGLAHRTSVQISKHELLSLSPRAKRGQQQYLASQGSDVEYSGERNRPQNRIRLTTALVPLTSPMITQNMINSSPQV